MKTNMTGVRSQIQSSEPNLNVTVRMYRGRPEFTRTSKYSELENNDYTGEENNDDGFGEVVAHDSVTVSSGTYAGKVVRVISQAALIGSGNRFFFSTSDDWNNTHAGFTAPYTPKPRYRPSLTVVGSTFYLAYVDTSGNVRIYTTSTTLTGASWTLSNTWALGVSGTAGAVATIGDGTACYVLSWDDPELVMYKYQRTAFAFWRPRKGYNPYNAMWFDVEHDGDGYHAIVFCGDNGITYSTRFVRGNYSEPVAIYGSDPDFPEHSVMISSLSTRDGRVFGILTRKLSSSLRRYYDTETFVIWSEDSMSYAMMDDSRISVESNRGKIHFLSDQALVVSQGVVDTGYDCYWMGNRTYVSIDGLEWNESGSGTQKNQVSMICPIITIYPHAWFEHYFNGQLYTITIADKVQKQYSGVDIDKINILSRGVSGQLMTQIPAISDIIEIPNSFFNPLNDYSYGLASYKGLWRIKKKQLQVYGATDSKNYQMSVLPLPLSDQFRFTVSFSIAYRTCPVGVAFWIDQNEATGYYDSYYVAYVDGALLKLSYISNDAETLITSGAITPLAIDATYKISILIDRGKVHIHLLQGSTWTSLEYDERSINTPIPTKFVTGLWSRLSATYLTDDFNSTSMTATVNSTSNFTLSEDTILIDEEVMKYKAKTATSLTIETRPLKGTTRTSHFTGAGVQLADQCVKFSNLEMYEIGKKHNTEDLMARVCYKSGIIPEFKSLFNVNYKTDSWNSGIWEATNGHSVVSNKIDLSTFMVTPVTASIFSAEIECDTLAVGETIGFTFWLFDASNSTSPRREFLYKRGASYPTLEYRVNGTTTKTLRVASRLPVIGDSEFSARIFVSNESVSLFFNGEMYGEMYLDTKYPPSGYIGPAGTGNFYSFRIAELSEPTPSYFWDFTESGDNVLKKISMGRNFYFIERETGVLAISQFRQGNRESLGSWSDNLLLARAITPDERYWAGGVTVWGAEVWAYAADPYGAGGRVDKVDAPFIWSEDLCRIEAKYQVRLLQAMRDSIEVEGVVDPCAEPADEVTITIDGQAKTYIIENIQIKITPQRHSMNVSLRRSESEVSTSAAIYWNGTHVWNETGIGWK